MKKRDNFRNLTVVMVLSALAAGCGPGGARAVAPRAVSDTNQHPTAIDDAVTQEGDGLAILVLSNDSDADGDVLKIVATGVPVNGSVAVNNNGTADLLSDDYLDYTPDSGYFGADSFSYTISDPAGLLGTAMVRIAEMSTAPIARDDTAATSADTPVIVAVLANDSDPRELTLNLVDITSPIHGSASIDDNATPADASDDFVEYVPGAGYTGSDGFAYTITNGTENATAFVTVFVGGSGAGAVSGDVTKGPVDGAIISLYRIDGEGLPEGTALAQTMTDARGKWAALVPLPREPLLAVSSGGRYVDETDSHPDPALRRVIQFDAGDEFAAVLPAAEDYVSINLYTNALLAKSRFETQLGNFPAVYATNRTLMSQAIGFDPVTTAPANPAAPSNDASVTAKQYALLLGGASNALNAVAQSSSFYDVTYSMARAFVDDLQDCRLDGSNQAGPVLFTVLGVQRAMPSNLDLNLQIIRFRNNNYAHYANVLASMDESTCGVSAAPPDTTAPVITILGAGTQTLEGGAPFTDAGATASDDRDGDLTAAIDVSGAVDPFTLGSYVLTYTVQDSAGNFGTATRQVNVVDTQAPLIALNGAGTVTVLIGTTYVDAGATALDALDGDLSAAIVVANPIDVNTPGTYRITYDVTDGAGNVAAQIARTVSVVDTTRPVITLLGNSPVTVEAGMAYVDAGATAVDLLDGDLTVAIVTAGNVDTATVGTYSISYDVMDSNANAAMQQVRVVYVIDSTAPAIALNGANPFVIEAPAAYIEPGATATDSFEGDLSATLVIDASAVDTMTPGSYTVTYDVSDSAGNNALTVFRTVTVQDTAAPVITLTGANPQNLEVNTAYVELGATAMDSLDGDITPSVIVDTMGVAPTSPGSYLVNYDVSDAAGNMAATASRIVIVADTTPPVITLTGADPQVIDAGTAYTELGATALDNFDGDVSSVIAIDATAVNTAVPGSYDVTYNVTDATGNVAIQVVRSVTVVDSTAPSITLAGANPQTIEAASAYLELGATAFDSNDGDLTPSIVIDASAVDTMVPGSYAVTYDVADNAGNDAVQGVRTVNVQDTTAPVITVSGPASINHEAATPFVDAGATAIDTIDGDLTASIVAGGAVDVNVTGSYVLTYDVTDAAGNSAAQVTRTVNVADNTAPVITLIGADPLQHEAGTPLADPGATAADSLDGDVTTSIVSGGSVNVNAVGDYVLTYDVVDAAGNAATRVTRTVQVRDTVAPIITLLGANPDTVTQGSGPYSDPGATASDGFDGDLTASVLVTGVVDTATSGIYNLSYDVNDSSSNAAATVSRTVNVVPPSQTTDTDGDGLSDAIELAITGDPTATQVNTFFIDPDPSITVRDGTSWATAYGGIEDIVAANGGFVPQGLSAAQPTYIVLGDTTSAPATPANPDLYQIVLSNGNCSHIAVIGSMDPGTLHPGAGLSEPTTILNAPDDRVLNGTNCDNLQFYQVQFVDSGGAAIADGGAVRLATGYATFDTVFFLRNEAAQEGGAIRIGNSFAPTVIRNSLFEANSVTTGIGLGGGAIALDNNAAIEITDAVFVDNSSVASGGAIYAVQNASVALADSHFGGNSTTLDGGALYMARNNVSPSTLLEHNVFSGNQAGREGGAIYNDCSLFTSPLRVFNNLFSGNAALRGGALAIDDCDSTEYDNNTYVFNEATSAGGGGAIHVDTFSTDAPNARPMPEIFDSIFYGNVDAGGVSVYSINNLSGWSQQQSFENLMDDPASATIWDVLIGDPELEFDVAWYLAQASSQAINLSGRNAGHATKFLARPEMTTDRYGAADAAKADAGYHYPGAYPGDAISVGADSQLQGNAGTVGQNLVISLLDGLGQTIGSGYRVSIDIAAGSAPVNVQPVSTAPDPLAPVGAWVAIDQGDGRYKLFVDTDGVPGPDTVTVNVYADGVLVGQAVFPVN